MKKILVVDDEKEVVEYISNALIRHGFELISALSAHQAKQKITEEFPEVILLDLIMPDTNGWELLSWIRTDLGRQTPVIIITAKDEMESIKKSYTLDADHYIIKPVNIKELIKAIETVCSLKGEENNEERESNTHLK